MPKLAMEGASPEELAWYVKHPNWDPRVRLAEPSERDFVRQQIRHEAAQKFANKAKGIREARLLGEDPNKILDKDSPARISSSCFAADGRSMDVAFMRMAIDMKMAQEEDCLLYTSPSPRDRQKSRMPSSA